MDYIETMVESDLIYDGRIIKVKNDTVRLHTGAIAKREVVVHNGGVGVIPIDADGNAYLVRQFRYPFGESVLEIPAGKLEIGEDPFECAVRELSEETGFTADEYTYLGRFYPTPGYCQETLHVYMARGLTAGKMHLDENEHLDVEKYPLKELVDMSMRGEILDAKTIIGILKANMVIFG
ncbi:MAG: NUDIX hydrolase [Ruminococcaceae bacterium]|nr:NUDIX hydrolase [Oscillospiraceae bacterium]